jgi:DNA-binding NarL/FixJ family response regulator
MTRIVIADDHKIIRDGLKTLLQAELNMELVGEASNGREAVQMALDLKPDVMVIDIAMPELNGIDATNKITSELPNTKIIALSMHSEQQFIVGMLKAGASGYLLKDCAFEELIDSIHTVMNNRKYISPQISSVLIDQLINPSQELHVSDILTDREREILQLIAEGISTKNIAEKLFISAKTVETHRKKIMEKLDLFTIPELTKYAIKKGLTSL